MGFLIGGILLTIYGIFCIIIAVIKPAKIWNMAKVEGFKKILGETGTVIFFIIWGAAATAGGIVLLLQYF